MPNQRPLSPHLQIYRWQWTMFFSIIHRATSVMITGGFAYLCIKMFCLGFFAETTGEFFNSLESTLIFYLLKIIVIWGLLVHFCLGIRHLIFDALKLLDMKYARLSGYVAFITANVIWIACVIC